MHDLALNIIVSNEDKFKNLAEKLLDDEIIDSNGIIAVLGDLRDTVII